MTPTRSSSASRPQADRDGDRVVRPVDLLGRADLGDALPDLEAARRDRRSDLGRLPDPPVRRRSPAGPRRPWRCPWRCRQTRQRQTPSAADSSAAVAGTLLGNGGVGGGSLVTSGLVGSVLGVGGVGGLVSQLISSALSLSAAASAVSVAASAAAASAVPRRSPRRVSSIVGGEIGRGLVRRGRAGHRLVTRLVVRAWVVGPSGFRLVVVDAGAAVVVVVVVVVVRGGGGSRLDDDRHDLSPGTQGRPGGRGSARTRCPCRCRPWPPGGLMTSTTKPAASSLVVAGPRSCS